MKSIFFKIALLVCLGSFLFLSSCGTSKKTSVNNPQKENTNMFSELSKRREIIVIEEENSNDRMELFSMEQDEGIAYYLSVGSLGHGDNVIQVYIDPFHELFIPLGSTLEEANATLQQIKDFYKQPKGATMEIMGCFNKYIPNDNLETVTLTRNRLFLNNQIRFSVEREGELRATFIDRSSFNSLMSSLKWYRKMHPKKQ